MGDAADLARDLRRLSGGSLDRLLEREARPVAARALREARDDAPVDTGLLRRSTTVEVSRTRGGQGDLVTITADTPYAEIAEARAPFVTPAGEIAADELELAVGDAIERELLHG